MTVKLIFTLILLQIGITVSGQPDGRAGSNRKGSIKRSYNSIHHTGLAPGYLIKKVGDTISAEPKDSHLSCFSGIDAADVIQKAINSVNDGCAIEISKGTYFIKRTITSGAKNNIRLTFAKGAKMVAAKNLNQPVIFLSKVIGWRITGLKINGDRQHQEKAIPGSLAIIPDGILISGCKNILIDSAIIYNVGQYGVWFEGKSQACGISHSLIYNTGWNPITFGTVTNCFAKFNEVADWSGVGISTYGRENMITNNIVHDSGKGGSWCIAVEGGGFNTISHNNCVRGTFGIFISGIADPTADPNTIPVGHNTISNNEISNWITDASGNFYGGTFIGASDNVIANNNIYCPNKKNGIWMGEEAARNRVLANRVNCLGQAIKVYSDHNELGNNKTISPADYGIYIWSGTDNHIRTDNDLTGSLQGVMRGVFVSSSAVNTRFK